MSGGPLNPPVWSVLISYRWSLPTFPLCASGILGSESQIIVWTQLFQGQPKGQFTAPLLRTVNPLVVGSIPTRGAMKSRAYEIWTAPPRLEELPGSCMVAVASELPVDRHGLRWTVLLKRLCTTVAPELEAR